MQGIHFDKEDLHLKTIYAIVVGAAVIASELFKQIVNKCIDHIVNKDSKKED